MSETPKQDAWIAGIGMMTAVGDCAAQTATSVRAGISRYQESSIYNKHFEPMTLALVPEDALPLLNEEIAAIQGLTSRQIRMLRLAGPAMREAMDACPFSAPIPLFLATPEPLPGHPHSITGAFFDYLEIQSEIQIDKTESRGVATGRAGGLQVLQAAFACLAKGKHGYVLLGGVDSYLDLYLLGTLDKDDRVLANGVMDGFCPGEGAGFILLCSNSVRNTHRPNPQVWVHPPGIARETGHRYSERPYRGDGLSEAVNHAVQRLNESKINTVFVSLNGENLGAKEWGVTVMRNQEHFNENYRLEHPADCFGDIGAAFAPVLIGLATIGLDKATLQGPSLVCCSSEQAQRSATCIERV